MKNTFLQTMRVVILAIILTIGVGYAFAYTWTAPTAAPPGGNTGSPLNVTGQGQSKLGGLSLNTSGDAQNGLIVWSESATKGLVGIGVTPTRKLDVNGDLRLRGHIYDSANSAGAQGQVLTRGSAGIVWSNTSTSGTTSPSSLWATGAGTSIHNTNGGNVGVGIIAPESSLHVKSSHGPLAAIRVSPTSNNIQASLAFTDQAGGLRYGIGKQEVMGNLADDTFFLWDYSLQKRFLHYFPNGNLMLNPAGGNVGIATAGVNQPTATLDVNGTLRVRGGSPGTGKFLSSSSDGTASWMSVRPSTQSTQILLSFGSNSANEQDLSCPSGMVMTGLRVYDWDSQRQSMKVKGIYCNTLVGQ